MTAHEWVVVRRVENGVSTLQIARSSELPNGLPTYWSRDGSSANLSLVVGCYTEKEASDYIGGLGNNFDLELFMRWTDQANEWAGIW